MLDNHIYNLMLQMTEENKSLWRIKNHYMGDASDCQDCKSFRQAMEKDKEDHIDKLMNLIKNHVS